MRRGRAKRQELQRAFQNLASLPIYTDMTSDMTIFTTLVSFAERHRLSVYDAAYLELALRSRWRRPMATFGPQRFRRE